MCLVYRLQSERRVQAYQYGQAQGRPTRREGSSRATHASISPWLTSYRGEMTPHLLSLQKDQYICSMHGSVLKRAQLCYYCSRLADICWVLTCRSTPQQFCLPCGRLRTQTLQYSLQRRDIDHTYTLGLTTPDAAPVRMFAG